DRVAGRAAAGEPGRDVDERDLAGGHRHRDRASRVRGGEIDRAACTGGFLNEVVAARRDGPGQGRDLPRGARGRGVLDGPAREADRRAGRGVELDEVVLQRGSAGGANALELSEP